jgi:rubredoxin
MVAAITLNLGIFAAVIVALCAIMAAVAFLRLRPTRVCPLCDAKVDQSARRCRTCGYRFTRERGVG